MQPMYYIGLDVHKRKISYCVKDGGGQIHAEGSISATRPDLNHWMRALPQPWSAAMEATMFTGWIYDHLKPHAAVLKVAPRRRFANGVARCAIATCWCARWCS
jgi:transposase